MRDYGIVSPRFWIGETGKSLRGNPEAQVLAMYLMTSPHATMTGVYHCPILYMAHETGLGMEGASKALARLIEGAFCQYDAASEYVFVLRMAEFQVGKSLAPNDKRVIGLRKEIRKLPVPHFIATFLDHYEQAFCLTDPGKRPRDLQGASKPLRSQEQDQEQEQEQKQEQEEHPPTPSSGSVAGGRRNPSCSQSKPSAVTTSTGAAVSPGTHRALQSKLVPEGFAEFYASFPRKQSRRDAEHAWQKLAPDQTLRTTLQAALDVQKQSPQWRKDNGSFIPLPATWINGRRWEDQLSSATAPTESWKARMRGAL